MLLSKLCVLLKGAMAERTSCGAARVRFASVIIKWISLLYIKCCEERMEVYEWLMLENKRKFAVFCANVAEC